MRKKIVFLNVIIFEDEICSLTFFCTYFLSLSFLHREKARMTEQVSGMLTQ